MRLLCRFDRVCRVNDLLFNAGYINSESFKGKSKSLFRIIKWSDLNFENFDEKIFDMVADDCVSESCTGN